MINYRGEAFWSHLADSNRGPSLYKSVALPAELRWREWWAVRDSNPRRPLGREIYSLEQLPLCEPPIIKDQMHELFAHASDCQILSRRYIFVNPSFL